MAKKPKPQTPEVMESNRLKRIVARRHPDYVGNLAEWTFLRQSIEGGPDYVNNNLYKHPKENSEIYAARIKRASDNNFNICQLVMDNYEGFIFQIPPEAAAELPPAIVDFMNKADLEGKPLICLAQEVMHWMATYGVVTVCIDKPSADMDPNELTAAQEADANLDPYAYVIHPTHLLDAKLDKGEFCWALIQEDVRDDEDPWTSTGAIVTRWRLWERDQWTLISCARSKDGTEVYSAISGPNDLGRVPLVQFCFTETKGLAAKGLLRDIAHIARAVFNKTSLLDEIHYAVTFPQLAIPYTGEIFNEQGLTPEGNTILTMGLHDVLPFPREAGPPVYVSPEAGPSTQLETSIKGLVILALTLALLEGEAGQEGGRNGGSGVSKAYVFEKLNRRLSNIADTLEQGFQNVIKMVALWLNIDPESLPPVAWNFPDNFEVRSLAQEIADTIALLGADVPSDRFKRELFKQIVRKAFPKLDPKLLEEIDEEIEAHDFDQQFNLGPDGMPLAPGGAGPSTDAAAGDAGGLEGKSQVQLNKAAKTDIKESGGMSEMSL